VISDARKKSLNAIIARNLNDKNGTGKIINSQDEAGGWPDYSEGIAPVDTDKDGMPDVYEQQHACLNYMVEDSSGDPDRDGLTSIAEYSLGTDPCNGDTDGGGESDASELERGNNPFYPGDDDSPALIDAEVIKKVSNDLRPHPDLQPNSNLIRYSADPSFETIRLFRSTSFSGPFELIAQLDPKAEQGLYRDGGLTNDQIYYYYLQGETNYGAASAPSHVFNGIPKTDPIPPIGSVVIQDHAPFSSSANVTLMLTSNASAGAGNPSLDAWQKPLYDASYILISNYPDFSDAKFLGFTPTVEWTLKPDKSGAASVYVYLLDELENFSELYHDSITVKPPGSLGKIKLHLLLKPHWPYFAGQMPTAESNLGSMVSIAGQSSFPPAYSDENGDAEMDGLPQGTYDLQVERPGFQKLLIPGVPVNGGQITDLGDEILTPYLVYLPLMRR